MAKIPTDFASLVKQSTAFRRLAEELLVSSKLSLTGITNLVVNHEDPALVDEFLNSCFMMKSLYRFTTNIDAVELQQGDAGGGHSVKYLDELIFGSVCVENNELGIPIFQIDQQTGKRKRNPDGFVNRKEVLLQTFDDKNLVIRNIDYCLDFCHSVPGEVDSRASWIFDIFRNAMVNRGCRLILVTNKKLILPFKVRTVEFPYVDDCSAKHIIDSFINLYERNNYKIIFSPSQIEQISRKLNGLTYTEAGDSFGYALQISCEKQAKIIDTTLTTRHLRARVNKSFMERGFGLTHLSPRPWEDYICSEGSSFTFDVRKILRDFNEIKCLKQQQSQILMRGDNDQPIADNIEAVQMRIPHIFVLYGRGGTGKSAFPIHFAGLMDFDVWDFNISACHSKFVGEGSLQMRESLKKISNSTHVVIRVDEYDRAMGSVGESGYGMHEAHKQVESEFMNWLQNMQENNTFVKQNIFVVLTTNHKDNITGPLLRSGRADLVIDIDNFDVKSLKETFLTSARRMYNRGLKIIGYNDMSMLQQDINALDLDLLSQIATEKGFTVRDVENLIVEMAAHNYYYKKGMEGLSWDTKSFAMVLERSQGSIRDESTGELKLGDRYILENRGKHDSSDENQREFTFVEQYNKIYDDEIIKACDNSFKE